MTLQTSLRRFALSERLALTVQPLLKEVVVAKTVPTHHIAVIDCSGSMSYDLPELRRQLKNKLPSLIKPKDTLTLIWFSGKNQFGVLQEAVEVRSLTDLSSLNQAIDRFLQPVGLTGFKQPLEEVAQVVDRIVAKVPEGAFSLFFMTDGYDNQWSTPDILKATAALTERLGSATFVEYGWNCNRALLSKMAETIGGELVFSEHFPDYEASFENQLLRNGRSVKKIQVPLKDTATLGYAFTWDAQGVITTFSVNEAGEVLAPEATTHVAYFSVPTTGVTGEDPNDAAVYIGLATLSQRLKTDEIFDTLRALADVRLVNRFVNCFSKQDYTDFQNAAVAAALDSSQRFVDGRDPNAVPRDDAFTVLDALDALAADDENKLYPRHEAFSYQRIGAGSVAKDERLKFTPSEENPGVRISSLVFNGTRPNVSILVKLQGSVTLPEDRPSVLPAVFPSFIHRNYTIIRDGIVHTRRLPVSLAQGTFDALQAEGLLAGETYEAGRIYVLDLSAVPVINRRMVQQVTARATFTQVFELEQLKADQKVFKFFRDKLAPRESKGYTLVYGAEAATWLKEQGLTDYNGFNPPSTSVPLNDVYTAKELDITIKGLASLPKVEDVQTKLAASKPLTLRESLLVRALDKVESFQNSDVYQDASNQTAVFQVWLETEAKAAVQKTRRLNTAIAKTKFAIVVGHAWFSDFSSLDENTLDFQPAGAPQSLTISAHLKDVEIGGKAD